MANSLEVEQQLEQLKASLERLVPAIKHVEIAEKATQMVAEIATEKVAILRKIQEADTAFRKQSRTDFSAMLSELKTTAEASAIDLLGTPDAVRKDLKVVSDTHETQLKQVGTNHEKQVAAIGKTIAEGATVIERLKKQVDELTAGLATAVGKTEKELTEFVTNINKTIGHIYHQFELRQEALAKVTSKLEHTNSGLEKFSKDLTDLNLPFRFEKMDSSLSATTLGMQNQQAFLSKLETALLNGQQEALRIQTEASNQLIENQKAVAKKATSQHIQLVVLLLLGFVGLVVLILLKR